MNRCLPAILICLMIVSGCQKSAGIESKSNLMIDDETGKRITMMNQTAEKMYELMEERNAQLARNQLELLSNQATTIKFTGITTIEGANALMQTIISANRVFNKAQFSMDEGMLAAARIRLAVDSLTHINQPIWLQYDKIFRDEAQRFKQGVAEKNVAQMKAAMEQLLAHYDLVRTAILIGRNPSLIERADSLFTFLRTQTYSGVIKFEQLSKSIDGLDTILDDLFSKRDSAAGALLIENNPMNWIFVIGSFIIVMLTYAGWRIYRFEHEFVTVFKARDGDKYL